MCHGRPIDGPMPTARSNGGRGVWAAPHLRAQTARWPLDGGWPRSNGRW